MSNIYNSIEDMIGHTPLLKLNKLMKKYQLKANLLAKCEFYNPLFSIKDRIALNMLQKAPFSKINDDTVFIEATSGNTGIGLAAFCAYRGYKLVIVMPENMAPEKIALIRHFGVEVLLTPASEGMAGALRKVEILKQRSDNLIEIRQFENPANVEAHQLTTATEIIEDTDGNVDAIVCGVGTGGTLSGVASTLKSCNPDLFVMAVEPAESAVLSGKPKGSHRIGGIGAGFVPPLYRADLVNEVFPVATNDAFAMSETVASTEGLPAGVSASAALVAAVNLASRDEMAGKNIVVILPDSIERYLSDVFFKKGDIVES
ncbi:MAG: cysteine synthase family protein [Alphaproteobacteria bacterium]|nr:cysteine synthase family protein [Alphaproteobacteria bacterium]